MQTICNKFIQTSAVTCLSWPPSSPGPIVGLADGKVRLATLKGNKATTLYNSDSYVVSLAPNPGGTGFLSGHADGSVVRWFLVDDPANKGQQVNTHRHITRNATRFTRIIQNIFKMFLLTGQGIGASSASLRAGLDRQSPGGGRKRQEDRILLGRRVRI